MDRKFLFFSLLVFFLLVNIFIFDFALAQLDIGSDDTATPGSTSLPNPLGAGLNDPRVIIGNVIKAILGIVGSLALVMFIYGGFLWVTSAGNEEKIKQGKSILLWATLGLFIIFFSYILVTFVIGAVTGSASPQAG